MPPLRGIRTQNLWQGQSALWRHQTHHQQVVFFSQQLHTNTPHSALVCYTSLPVSWFFCKWQNQLMWFVLISLCPASISGDTPLIMHQVSITTGNRYLFAWLGFLGTLPARCTKSPWQQTTLISVPDWCFWGHSPLWSINTCNALAGTIFSHSTLHDMTNLITEIPEVGVQLPEWW